MVARLAIAGEVTVNEATAMRGLRKGSLGFRENKVAREAATDYGGSLMETVGRRKRRKVSRIG
jgi:hypothetical protein